MTPHSAAANFPFSPNLSQLQHQGSSPHPHVKRSPFTSALGASFSNTGIPPNFDSPASNSKFLAAYLSGDAAAVAAFSAGINLQSNEEEIKKKNLEEVLRLLNSRPGRISEEGVERLAKRIGLQFYRDDTSRKGVHTLSLSGKIVVVDFEFQDGKFSRVEISLADTPGPASKLVPLAAAILQQDLIPQNYNITSSLSALADNLQRLAKPDSLSVPPTLNCYTAVAGMYTSLKKVWEKQVEVMGETDALCKGMGRPGMHIRNKIGMSIDYWRQRRFLQGGGKTTGSSGDIQSSKDEEGEDIWRVIVEVDEMGPDSFMTPVRMADDWVTADVLKPSDESMFSLGQREINWLEPPVINADHVMDAEASQKVNAARFVARLDPPVAVGIQDEWEIYNNAQSGQLPISPMLPIDVLLLGSAAANKNSEHQEVRSQREVWTPDGSARHEYVMNLMKPQYGRIIEEIPFSHPRQLISIFQSLRKYCLYSTLLKSAFASKPSDGTLKDNNNGSKTDAESNNSSSESDNLDADFDAFMNDSNAPAATAAGDSKSHVPVDISLDLVPLSLDAYFPSSKPGDVLQLRIELSQNAEINALLQSSSHGLVSEASIDAAKLRKVAEVSEDIGILIEYLRKQGASKPAKQEDEDVTMK